MRVYTLSSAGIVCDAGKILVGEAGRGRKLVAVALPPESIMESDSREGGRTNLLVECRGDATSALVLIPDQSGFRGGWHLRAARTTDLWDLVVALGDHQTDEQMQEVRSHDLPHDAVVIAAGECAQGDAGRAGGGPELLIVLRHGQAVEIVRSGRLYGKPATTRLECVVGLVVATHPRQDAEERLAATKWEAVAAASVGEPVETVLSWGGGTRRHREAAWASRPVLVDAAGVAHVFDGQPIAGVVEVLEDCSVHSGYQSGQKSAFLVALYAGVTYRGNERQDGPVAQEEDKPFGTSLGALLSEAREKPC